jgi:hypothetical protein
MLLALASCKKNEPIDEAKAAGKTIANFPQITADIFKPMDAASSFRPRKSWVATPGIFGAQAINILESHGAGLRFD